MAAVALAALSTAVLTLPAGAAAIRIPLVATVGHMSLQVVRLDHPASLSVSVGGTALPRWPPPRRARLVAAGAGARDGRPPGALPARLATIVVVPDGTAHAYAVPGWPGRIVVTAGMLDGLTRTSAGCC